MVQCSIRGTADCINIAKANRVEFFAIPVSDIRAILEDKAREISEARGEQMA